MTSSHTPSHTLTQQRKDDHLRITLDQDVASTASSGFGTFQFVHQALPEVNYDAITLDQTFLGKQLKAPLLISCMTGGTQRAQEINERLARSAHTHTIAMGLGSMRVLLKDPSLLPTFQVRTWAPECLVLANVGAVQLQQDVTAEDVCELAKRVEADAVVLHLNPLQEVLQPEGDRNWQGVLGKIAHLVRHVTIPVVVKEVGHGLSRRAIASLKDVGVAALDVAGAGGTSWSQVEAHRANTPLQATVAQSFQGWGIPTALSLTWAREIAPQMPLIASGGLRSGLDVAKALYLGADLCGIAHPFLLAATQSQDALDGAIALILEQLKVILFATGSGTLDALRNAEVYCP